MNELYSRLSKKLFFFIGTNVIESEEHCLFMAEQIKLIMNKYNVEFIFKVSFDKANRSSINSYRGLGFEKGLQVLRKLKDMGFLLITDVHESWQCQPVGEIVDVLQIPAFLCRQTDLLEAAAKTGKVINIKKGQFCSSAVLHKSKEKVIAFGNPNVILCERGNMFGYQDLVVDPRNLYWLQSDSNLVSMDITHCLQQPAQIKSDGTVCAGGLRELIPLMGKMALTLGVNGIFMEVHDNPEVAKCDGPTQLYLRDLESFLDNLNIPKKIILNQYNIYIGFDSSNFGQELAAEVCKRSILKETKISDKKNLNINFIKLKELRDRHLYWREHDTLSATEFTYSRFLTPYLNNYQGWAIFCDSDFLYRCDIKDIFDSIELDETKAVYLVKHPEDLQASGVKMNNKPQSSYPRKNWTSMMIINCGHPSCRTLTPEVVNSQTGKYLHRLEWCNDNEIGELNPTYNFLVENYVSLELNPNHEGKHGINNPKVLHYTDGGPWFENYRDCEYSDLWINYISDEEKVKIGL